jgi:hypothetical protein
VPSSAAQSVPEWNARQREDDGGRLGYVAERRTARRGFGAARECSEDRLGDRLVVLVAVGICRDLDRLRCLARVEVLPVGYVEQSAR